MIDNAVLRAWRAALKSAAPRRRAQAEPLFAFLSLLDNPYARVLSEHPLEAVTARDARELEHAVVAQHADGALDPQGAADWLGLIHAVRRKLDPGGNTLPPTRLAAAFPPQTSPFAPGHMELADLGALWREALTVWIRRSSIEALHDEWAAAILLSSVFFGALLDPTKLRGLLDRINRHELPAVAPACRTFEFDLPYQGLGNYHLQRWALDPITEMLLYRLPTSVKPIGEKTAVQGFAEILAGPGFDIDMPKGLRHLVDCASADWRTRAAPVELQTSQRAIQSHAFHGLTWARFAGRDLSSCSAQLTESEGLPHIEDAFVEAMDELRVLHPWLEPLLDAIALQTRELASAAISELRTDWSENATSCIYLDWVDAELFGRSASGKSISIESVRERVGTALPLLLAALGDTNPAKLDTQQLEDIYSELTSAGVSGQQLIHLVAGLRDFHAHLRTRFNKAPISNEREVFGEEGELLPVDANLPSFDDFEAARAWLDQQVAKRVDPEMIATAQLVMILAFRLGLRRMEIFGLRIGDVHLHGRMMIIVCPHLKRRLKTLNATRMLPAYAFLSREEAALVERWIANRLDSIRSADEPESDVRYLFAEFAGKSPLSWVDRVCALVCSAIRAVTCDKRLFLHHFRHAFGTWTYLRLRAAEFPELVAHFEHMPLTASALRSGRRLTVHLLGRATPPQRAGTQCVARLLGHSGALVSLCHYIHATDLVLGAIAAREVRLVDSSVLVAASGLSSSAAYEALGRGIDTLLTSCRQKVMRSTHPPAESAPPAITSRGRGRPRKAPPHEAPGWISLERVLEVLHLGFDRKFDAGAIADIVAITAAEVETMLASGRKWAPQLALTDAQGEVSAPHTFRGDAERAFLRRIEPLLADMRDRAPGLYRSGLELHLENLDRKTWDTVFHGKAYQAELKTYLRFLKSLGLDAAEFQWVVRHPPTDQPPRLLLPNWANRAYPKWSPEHVRRIGPLNLERHRGYADWAGIQAIDTDGLARGKLIGTILYIARANLDCKIGQEPSR
ncbi:MAG: site-specific integrase [Rhodocyclaceae bacterium]|nr:site-specific integrase [Rhodocyclaceae bacterium]